MIHWISERGLQILNRLDSTMAIEECWTCKRALDGALVQLDFLLASLRVRVVKAWIDQSLPIGLDHRCVHCLIRIGGARPAKIKRCTKLKHWQPHLDENGTPSPFHTAVAIALTKLPVVSAEGLEQCLVGAGRNHGRHGSQHLRFVPSRLLADLRLRRRQTKSANYIGKNCGIGNQISWNGCWDNPQNGRFCGQWNMELVDGCQNNRSHLNLLTCWNNCLQEILACLWPNLV